MINLIYDGTFEGVLTAVYKGLSFPPSAVSIVSEAEFQPDLFSEWQTVTTEPETARSFYKKIVQHFSREICLDIGYIFISEQPGSADLLLSYLRELQTHGDSVVNNYANPVIFKVRRLREQINHEIQRLYGFVRFRKMKDAVFYGPIEPEYNVVQFLAPHFKSRFADQKWLIHDTRRNTGIFYDTRQCLYLPNVDIDLKNVLKDTAGVNQFYDEQEQGYQAIWKQYFNSIAITERTRKKLQRQNMPVRYWKYLIEEVRP